jgi:hypothetical protein
MYVIKYVIIPPVELACPECPCMIINDEVKTCQNLGTTSLMTILKHSENTRDLLIIVKYDLVGRTFKEMISFSKESTIDRSSFS